MDMLAGFSGDETMGAKGKVDENFSAKAEPLRPGVTLSLEPLLGDATSLPTSAIDDGDMSCSVFCSD